MVCRRKIDELKAIEQLPFVWIGRLALILFFFFLELKTPIMIFWVKSNQTKGRDHERTHKMSTWTESESWERNDDEEEYKKKCDGTSAMLVIREIIISQN